MTPARLLWPVLLPAALLAVGPPPRPAYRVSPAAGDAAADPLTAVRAELPRPARAATAAHFRLLAPDGKALSASVNTDLTGGVLTLTPTHQLAPRTRYTAEIKGLVGKDGAALPAYRWSFTTGERRVKGQQFRFRATEIDPRGRLTSLAVGPDDHLYAADVFGDVRRYVLDDAGGVKSRAVVARLPKQQIIGICFDPKATAARPVLWVSHARRKAGIWAGVVSRLELAGGAAKRADYLTGLPCVENLEHQPNGIAFGPDGKLYQAVGGTCTLGGTPNWGAAESPLSAAVIVADVNSPKFNGGRLPCDVRTGAPVSYDPRRPGAPVRVYATGLRNALDLCFHSSGHLFTATNGNSIRGKVFTPSTKGVPAVNATPREALCRVVEGRYYGHPNPSRGEYVLLGGNPAPDAPWRVPEYPAGVRPEKGFDPALLYDLRPGGGNSANGLDEYAGPGAKGALRGRLLAAYFSGGRCIQTFAIAKDGKVTDERPLVDGEGRVIRFAQPLDVAVHRKTGRIYVAAFGNWTGQGVEATGGGLWVLSPL